MKEYIRKEDIDKLLEYRLDVWCGPEYYACSIIQDDINDLPTVEAVEVVHGKWVWDNRFHDYTCSICHNWDLKTPNYCSNCGALMDGEK